MRDWARGFVRHPLVLVLLLATSLPLVGWVGVHTWLPAHVEAKTGRSEIPRALCLHCHRKVVAPPVAGAAAEPGYMSPTALAVSPDGRLLYAAASGADRLLEVDLETGTVGRSVGIPGGPHSLAVSADGLRLAVSSRHGDRVHLLDTESLEILQQIEVAEPLGLALSADGGRLFVAAAFGDAIVALRTESPESAIRFVAGNQPYAVALAVDESLVAVANRLVQPVPPGVLASSEITLIDPRAGRVLERRELASAHLSEGIAISRDGSFALASVVRFRNLLPLTQVARGAVMNSAVAFVEARPGGRTVQFPLDEVNAYFSDPSGVALTPDDRIAFVAHAGARVVSVVDVGAMRRIVSGAEPSSLDALADDLGASTRYVLARIPTLDAPGALAMSPGGRRLYVAERLADSIAVIDTERREVIDRIDLGGPEVMTATRRGERVFHDGSVTFQGQFSCRSCHPDGHSDALIWDFEIDGVGKNLVDTRSLQGIRDTPPFKWNGKNPSLATQCGPRFARVLTRSDPFPPDRLRDLVAYIESLPVSPKRVPAELSEAIERGREVFSRLHDNEGRPIPKIQRCPTCHPPPLFTDRLPADVGTDGKFDTPHLFDVATTAPYLHDGRALTLEEIWTVHSPEDTHGTTNDLTKTQLNDLLVYLRTL